MATNTTPVKPSNTVPILGGASSYSVTPIKGEFDDRKMNNFLECLKKKKLFCLI